MNKKVYVSPEMKVIDMEVNTCLLAASSTDECETPGYYKFLETEFGFKFYGCYYTKKFRNGEMLAQYYPHTHSYRVYAMYNRGVKDTLLIVPCKTKSEVCYALRHYYEDVINTF